ncbi:MAG: hypothetical protein CMH98_16395 [Oceanospirillaceae bacterium]|nr:hypothetical protein [Oceanospirillaceae bacterium]
MKCTTLVFQGEVPIGASIKVQNTRDEIIDTPVVAGSFYNLDTENRIMVNFIQNLVNGNTGGLSACDIIERANDIQKQCDDLYTWHDQRNDVFRTPFDHSKLPDWILNIEPSAKPLDGLQQGRYAVVDQHGNHQALIDIRPRQTDISIDNFPGQKIYHSTTLPHKTLGDFISDMRRIGINLTVDPTLFTAPTSKDNS